MKQKICDLMTAGGINFCLCMFFLVAASYSAVVLGAFHITTLITMFAAATNGCVVLHSVSVVCESLRRCRVEKQQSIRDQQEKIEEVRQAKQENRNLRQLNKELRQAVKDFNINVDIEALSREANLKDDDDAVLLDDIEL